MTSSSTIQGTCSFSQREKEVPTREVTSSCTIAWPGITQAVTSRKVKAANPLYFSQLGFDSTRLAARNPIETDIHPRGKKTLVLLLHDLFNRFYFAAGDSLRDTRPYSTNDMEVISFRQLSRRGFCDGNNVDDV